MTLVSTTKDADALTITVVSEFAAPPERVWQVWSDPRQLERWWGPPTWPATFEEHDFTPGGRASYYMTGPDGEKSRGWWRFTAIEAPHTLAIVDGFADESGQPNDTMPSITFDVDLAAQGDGTRMTVRTSFADTEQMEQLVAMGMEEGMQEAQSQIDAVLAD